MSTFTFPGRARPHHEPNPYGATRPQSVWRHAGPVLIGGWPWGWGAHRVGFAEGERRPWTCAGCGRKHRGAPTEFGPLWFPAGTFGLDGLDDETVCPPCAEARCKAAFDRCHLAVPVGCGRHSLVRPA